MVRPGSVDALKQLSKMVMRMAYREHTGRIKMD